MSIFLRYNITDEDELLDGGAKLAAFFDKREANEQKVAPLKTGTGR